MASKAHCVRLPDEADQRIDAIASASIRPISSVTAFAISHALHLAHTDPDAFASMSIAGLQSDRSDRRVHTSVSDPTLAHLLASLMSVYAEQFKTPVRAHQAMRAAILSWLSTGTNEDLITQVGAPVVHDKVAAMT